MKNRVSNLIGGKAAGLWMGTFHSVCLRILRRNANIIDFNSDFTIYDVADQNTVVKNCMKELNIDTKQLSPRNVRNRISMAKNEMITPEKFEKLHEDDFKYKNYIKIYKKYQATLKKNNSMDFDDLINNTIAIFKENNEALEFYQRKFKYILIDEYQDTNYAQYLFALLLSGGYNNICAVGDADQSIYKFRGADIRNIYEFEKDYKNSKIIKLEQNYRSSQTILDAANSVISNNLSRKAKKLWTSNGKGEKINYYQAYTEKDEANYVYSKIKQYKEGSFDEFAILYRTNAQSRLFEDIFREKGIPYQMIGGLKFYERMEIKDVLAYLKLIQNPADDISFERIVNVPKRSIGKKSVEKLYDFANTKGLSLYEALLEIEDCYTLSPRVIKSLKNFREIIRQVRIELTNLTVLDVFDRVIDKSGYIKDLELKDTIQDTTRIENVKELKSVIIDFVKNHEDDPTLSNFLAITTLQAGIDNLDDDVKGVLMMTLHSAKGLEFPNVFLVGMEENLFPSFMSIQSNEDIEEERRLCYVGITRAEKQLFITHSVSRMLYGKTNRNQISRFIEEIPETLLNFDHKSASKVLINSTSYIKKSNNVSKQVINSGNDYRAGMKVKHKIFGSGTVIDSKGDVLTIAFEGKGIKKLMAGIVPIEIVG